VKLLSDYLAEPWDPEHRNLDRVLEAEIKRLADEKERRELVSKIRKLWNEKGLKEEKIERRAI